MTESFFLSVVMCTRDRASSLDRVLNSICRMSVPAGLRWEMILVDNGSTDDTPLVVERFQKKIPIRRVFEPRAGLSNARNAGVAAAAGDYIIWTDDDVEVDENWLAGYAQAFSMFPDGVIFGGRITPVLEAPSPVWFKDNTNVLRDVLAMRDFGDGYMPLSGRDGVIPYGANYAIRTTEQRLYPYDPELGVSPGKRRTGEETGLMIAMFDAGLKGYWVPNATVFHIISAARQTEKYIRDYYAGRGETMAFRVLMAKHRSRFRFIITQSVQKIINIILFRTFRAFLPPSWWIRRLMAVGMHSGALNYAVNQYPER